MYCAASVAIDEIKPLQPRGGQAEDQADRRGDDARERNAEEHRDREPVREIGRGEGAEAEEGGMADRDLAGEADHDVQPERGDAEDADLDQQAEAVFVERRSGAKQISTMPAIIALRLVVVGNIGGVRRIAGAEIAGGNEGRACHGDYTRSMSLVPNRP